jgi:hypothetical protein
MKMQFQVWVAGLAMGVEMKARAKKIKKRSAKTTSTPTRKSKLQQVA